MPADIRNFFGNKTSTPIREKEVKKEEDPKKKRAKSRKIIDDSDEEEPVPKKATPKKAPPKKPTKKEEPKAEETTTEDYFASTSKSKPKSTKSTPRKPNPPPNTETSSRSSTRKAKAVVYNNNLADEELAFLDDDEDAGDDIFAAGVKKAGKEKDAYVESESDDEPVVAKQNKPSANRKASRTDGDVSGKTATAERHASPDVIMIDQPTGSVTSRKRKSVELDSEEDEEEIKPKIKSVKSQSTKPPPAKKARAPAKKPLETEKSAVQAILDNIPTVRAPTPPAKDPNHKYDWKKGGQGGGGGNAGPPPAAGSKEMPVGAENCLAGMSFVFTGLLETLSRDDGQALVKRYGGKVTTAPSGKTSFVVLGSDAGPSKLRKIHELKIKTIDEDGLFSIIRELPANGGDGQAAEKHMEKKTAEMEKIKREAEEMEKEERKKALEAEKDRKTAEKLAAATGSRAPPPRAPPPSSLLWTSKYAPTAINQICGNKGQVEKIQKWLKGWAQAHKYEFSKKGPDGLGGYRAIMIHGPPGIGKTTAAHLAAKLAGYDVLENNASDTRSKKMVETGLNEVLSNNSLRGYYAGDGKPVDATKKNIVLIMDEVDGMSAGDRGGVGAMAKICKKTDIPMILICNEFNQQKMKPFEHVTFPIPFKRPTVDMVRSRIATICHREGMKLPMNVIDALIEGSNKDIRQIINMISTAKLDESSMDFDDTKAMTKAWEKSVVLKPWDICHKILGGGMFAPSSKATLNDKLELYFNDHEKSFLMVQENYLNQKPMLASSYQGRQQHLKTLQLMDQAAESISDGDLVDRMIHGSQQQWSLMPTHGIFSMVRPASFISGAGSGTKFTTWLGNNSKQGKLTRYVKEIQSHMRLRTSGDRHEIRQQYLPVLWTRLIDRLQREGKSAAEEVIELMDSYFLTREDFDFIMELGLGPQDESRVKIDSQAKATFTRLYNQKSHPMPFMKASNVMAPAAKSKADKPDLEEALEEDDEPEAAEPEVKAEDEILEEELKKDKFIKQPKSKKPAAKKPAKKKASKAEEDDEEDSEEEVKPKPKAKAKATSKGKSKK
ncbi:DNA polymerase III clamp loader subunit, C-terminal [Glarea lozoyensis ATCC 20868]|uniref:Replication factor C subunit 1 n=2 Tax=Glarea lozoyensis TaxID=101852 RepID=S3DFC3_GLAL2|nr:DNA polymerase III clamp loader subunit, C-terminal [Glarea lozoyensis ATCC 20868]EHK96209.1 putative Replication factor C subunit 1 [Glarea lozoyensis 74030]EPE30681.1 DNA polymerase III clamp loader subunit, C-terminal [Glarea lozoyensis ATCC 20868]